MKNIAKEKATVLIVTYPIFRGREYLKSMFFIAVMKILNRFSKFRLCLDFLEPPLLMPEIASRDTVTKKVLYALRYLQEREYLKAAHHVITGGDEMSEDLKQKYNLFNKPFSVIAQGINVADFPLNERKQKADAFTIFYGGTLTRARGMDYLFKCMDGLSQSYPIKLVCCGRIYGRPEISSKSWLTVYSDLSYNEYVKLITTVADAAILPYPVNDWWGKISISKVATYAAAGVPILSTALPHTGSFLRQWECGLVANTWEEMGRLAIKLYEEPILCNKLGKNARRAAESCLDWEVLVPKLKHVLYSFQ
jgi:glycosyltransferase involved in cell wall biosynthesis